MEFDKKLCQKIVSAFSDSEKQFGDVNFTDEEKILLKQYYVAIMSQDLFNGSLKYEVQEIVTAFLICTTKNYKGDWDGKSFWDRISNEIIYRPDYQSQLPAIGACLERYGRPSFKTVSRTSGDHRYVESLFFQAYSPRVSVNAFIDLAWSFYRDPDVFDLNYFDTEEQQQHCQAIIQDLDKYYSNSDIESGITIESKSYSIRSGLRYAFKEDPVAAAKMLRRVLRYIDSIYHHSDGVGEEEGYLGSLCNQYVPKLLASFYRPQSGEKPQRQKITVDDIQKVKALFYYSEREHETFLMLPRIRLYKDDQQFKNAEVTLFLRSNGEDVQVFKKTYSTVGEHYKHLLDEIYIPLDGFLQFCISEFSFRVTLSFDGMEPIYDSKQTLFRKYVVFKGEKEVATKLVQPSEFVVLHPSFFDISKNVHSSQNPVIYSEFLFSISPVEGDRISYSGTYYFFGDKQTGAHFLYDEAKTFRVNGAAFQFLGVTYDVYKSIGSLIIRCDQQIQSEHLALQLYDKSNALIKTVPISTTVADSDVSLIDLSALLTKGDDPLNSLSTIVVTDVTKGQTLFCDHLALFPDISIQRGESPYLRERTEMTLSLFGHTFAATAEKNETVCDIPAFGGTLSISAPYFSWRINDNEVHWEPLDSDQPLLKRAFQSNDLLVIDSFYDEVCLFCGETKVSKDPKTGKFLLGNYLYGPLGTLAFERDLDVHAQIDGTTFKIFSLTSKAYLKSKSADSVFELNGNSLSVNLADNFVGDPNALFHLELVPDQGNSLIFTGRFARDPLVIPNVASGPYTYHLSYSESALNNPLLSGDFYVGDPNSLAYQGVNKILISKISRIKMSDVYLTDIRYEGDDGFGPAYLCRVHSPWFKTIQGELVVKAGNSLSSIRYLGKDGLYHDFSIDISKKKLAFEKAD